MDKEKAKKIMIVGVGDIGKISNHLLAMAKKHDVAIVAATKREDIPSDILQRFVEQEVELMDIEEAKEQGIETGGIMPKRDVEIVLPFENSHILEQNISVLIKDKKKPKQYVPRTIGKVNNKPLNRNSGRR